MQVDDFGELPASQRRAVSATGPMTSISKSAGGSSMMSPAFTCGRTHAKSRAIGCAFVSFTSAACAGMKSAYADAWMNRISPAFFFVKRR